MFHLVTCHNRKIRVAIDNGPFVHVLAVGLFALIHAGCEIGKGIDILVLHLLAKRVLADAATRLFLHHVTVCPMIVSKLAEEGVELVGECAFFRVVAGEFAGE